MENLQTFHTLHLSYLPSANGTKEKKINREIPPYSLPDKGSKILKQAI